jgi:hypothetical protein
MIRNIFIFMKVLYVQVVMKIRKRVGDKRILSYFHWTNNHSLPLHHLLETK